MHSIEGIRSLNRKAAARAKRVAAESETSRHCSYSGDVENGVVLHSAKQRSTAFIEGGKARVFLAAWLGTNSAEAHNKLVESYFAHSPRL
jgi:hypothetical protein